MRSTIYQTYIMVFFPEPAAIFPQKSQKKSVLQLYGPYELYLDTIVVLQFPGVCIHFPVSPGDSTDMPKRPTGHQACPFVTHV